METDPSGRIVIVIVGVLAASVGVSVFAQRRGSAQQDHVAIERLHQQDIDATLSDKADALAQLWDRDAVRLSQGGAAEVGKDTIYADDKRWQAQNTGRTLDYKPQIKDLQIAGDWAFEWGYFEGSSKASADAAPVTVRGKQLRILKRQPDGSWKFARVMTLIDSRQ